MRAGIRCRLHASSYAGGVSAKSACRALRSMHSDFVSVYIHGAYSSLAGPRSRHLQEGWRVCALFAAQPVCLCASTACGQVFADPKCGVPNDDLLSGDVMLACGNFAHSYLYTGAGVPRGCLGNELIILDQCNSFGLLCEIFWRVQTYLERVHKGCFC